MKGEGGKEVARQVSPMGRAPCCNGEHAGLKKGPWTHEEDEKLKAFILAHPSTSWRLVPLKAGLIRCGKSCRLRWMNYLRPDIRRGNFSPDEEELIIQLHSAVGNKWSVIAAQLPGRTDNEIKNLWNTKLRKILVLKGINPLTHQPLCNPLLSDYVKQCLRSIEHMLISRFVGQPPMADGAPDFSLPPPASISAVQSTDGPDQRSHLQSSNGGSGDSSSTFDQTSPGCDNFPLDLFLGDDSFLPINPGYLNELVAGASSHFSLRDLPEDLGGQSLWS